MGSIKVFKIDWLKNSPKLLPEELNCLYVVNSGTEANEAALKLAKRATKRSRIVSFKGAYHGSTHGSLSISEMKIKSTLLDHFCQMFSFAF